MPIFNFESSEENSRQIEIAKTNYFLAKLREILEIDYEICVKWAYGGAFNGAGLVTKNENLVIVYFHWKKPELHNVNYISVNISNIWITVETPFPVEFEKELRKADAEFNELLNDRKSKTLNQVKRFSFDIYYQKNEELEAVEKFAEIIKSEFVEITTFPYPKLMPPDFPIKNFDVEIVLDKTISATEFIERLRKYTPKISEQIFDSGIHTGYGEIPGFPFGLTIYARQF